MSPRSRRVLLTAVVLALSAWMVPRILHAPLQSALNDPDLHYHLALSRMIVDAGGWLGTVPQAAHIGWAEAFVDKEFLFHVVTSMGHALAGEPGVTGAVHLLALGVPVVLAVGAVHGAGVGAALGAVCLATVMSPLFLFRMALLRPAVLAVLVFSWLLVALLRRSAVHAALACMAFALGYHALYVPLLVVLVAGAAGWRRDPALFRAAGAALGGLMLGTLVNPYFPGTLELAWMHARIALAPDAAADVGEELRPLPGNQLVLHLGFHLAVLALVAARNATRAEGEAPAGRDTAWLAACAGLLAVATMQNGRALEFLVPVVTLLLAREWAPLLRRRMLVPGLAGAALFQAAVFTVAITAPQRGQERAEGAMAAARAIPAEAAGALVLNTSWTRTPYFLHLRPDLRFVDILDPNFLRVARPDLHHLRRAFNAGMVGDPRHAAREAFGASLVLADQLEAVQQLEADPGFTRLHPADTSAMSRLHEVPFVYRVHDVPPAAMVQELDVAWLASSAGDGFRAAHPSMATAWTRAAPGTAGGGPAAPVYLDLGLDAPPAPQGHTRCAVVGPSRGEVARLQGATLLGLGGGRNLRAWFNGRPLFASVQALPAPRLVSVLVPLPRPLAAGDELHVVACSAVTSPFLGVAVSLWTEGALAQACASRPPIPAAHADVEFPFRSTSWPTCLAPLAAPAVPSSR